MTKILKITGIIFIITLMSAYRYPEIYLGSFSGSVPAFLPADSTGIKIYNSNCLNCHKESVESLAPGLGVLATMSPRSIYTSLTTGKMRQQGVALSDDERKKVSEWITKTTMKTSEMSKENIQELLLAKNANTETVTDFIALMNDCEFARYTPSSEVTMQKDYDRAVTLIADLEKQL